MIVMMVVVLMVIMSILTQSLLPALSIHIFLTFHLHLLPSLSPTISDGHLQVTEISIL
jgi:hypothetical protein